MKSFGREHEASLFGRGFINCCLAQMTTIKEWELSTEATREEYRLVLHLAVKSIA